jgi:hypothetical protein
MTPPIQIKPEELASLTAVKVVGAVTSDQMAAISRQLYSLTEWVNFLESVRGGGAGTPPPPPPKWPP